MRVACSWSGGKDSCFALIKAMALGAEPQVLLNMMNENGQVSRSHGLAKAVLQQQAAAMNLPMVNVRATWAEYEANFVAALTRIKTDYALEAAVFGDIDIASHRAWEEKVSQAAGLKAMLPLWQGDRVDLVFQMLDAGIEAVITSCYLTLGADFLGRTITRELVAELQDMGVDACGENGEYHTVVTNCPLFAQPIALPSHQKATHGQYCFLTW